MDKRKNILIIDDNEINLMYMRFILGVEFKEYLISIAYSGQEGIDLAEKELPDVIILDLLMPGMDGYEACRRLKASSVTGDIPVLMVSASGNQPEVRVTGLQSGADAFISKPFDRKEFIALVQVMLRIKRAEDELRIRNRELELFIQEIEAYQMMLKRLNKELTVTEEREKRKIAEYLHDGVGQKLSLAHMKLSALSIREHPPQVAKSLADTTELIHSAINETRTLTYDLSPPILYELGLVPAIRWKLEQMEKIHGFRTSLACHCEEPAFHNDANILLYRMVSELLSNVIKHAEADFIEVSLDRNERNFYVSVKDNGKGFNTDKMQREGEPSGFGLFSIRERLDSLNGSLELNQNFPRGTDATVIIPV